MKNLGIGGRNNTRPVRLRHGEIMRFPSSGFFRLNSFRNEKRNSSNRYYRRERLLSDGAVARSNRAQDRYAVRSALRCFDWWRDQRPPRLFFGAARSWSSHSAARIELPCEHLRA